MKGTKGMVDVRSHNRRVWDLEVAKGNRWTVPVTSAEVARARAGDWQVVLTPIKPVPRSWFGDLEGARLLGLASGGGQQCPLFAAAGAEVTVFDNSPAQLARDQEVAARDGLAIKTVEGDMADLSVFDDESFDLVFHPCSNCFSADILPVWREVHRVLRPGGALLAGFINPLMFIFDEARAEEGELAVRHPIPYSDLESLSEDERRLRGDDEPLSFGHTLADQIGGQTAAGLAITGFYEDIWGHDESPIDRIIPTFAATRSIKL